MKTTVAVVAAIIAVIALLYVTTSPTPLPEMTAAERQEVVGEVQRTFDAWIATGPTNDLDAAMEFFVDDASAEFVGEPVIFVNRLQAYSTKGEIVEAFEPAIANRSGTNYTTTNNSFSVVSHDAVMQAYEGTYSVTNLEGVSGPDYPLTVTILWVRRDGAWKILHLHQSWSTDVQ